MLRLYHRLIACNIARRSQAPEKVTVTDLFYMRGTDVGFVNIPYLLARDLPKIYEDHKDTWAWVAPRPERQQVVAAGALDAAEDAPVVDDGAQAVPAPVKRGRSWLARSTRKAEREVLDSMTCDFSRFTTWTVIGLSRMMDQAGVRMSSSQTPDFSTPYLFLWYDDFELFMHDKIKPGRPRCKEIDEVGEVSII
ncbi:hypothetical protein Tco_1302035 [Tanacetum coccineum]